MYINEKQNNLTILKRIIIQMVKPAGQTLVTARQLVNCKTSDELQGKLLAKENRNKMIR